jgi:hypothetical protein
MYRGNLKCFPNTSHELSINVKFLTKSADVQSSNINWDDVMTQNNLIITILVGI